MPSPPAFPRDNGFSALRGLMAVVIVIHHFNHDSGARVGGFFPRLIDGVPVFFTLSGLLVFLAAEKAERTGLGWKAFFLNRYLRLVPALLVFAVAAPVVLMALGLLSFGALDPAQATTWLASMAVLVPLYDPPALVAAHFGQIDDQLYTIPAELTFYLAVPLVVLASRKWGLLSVLAAILAIAACVSGAAHLLGPEALAVVQATFFERAPFFVAGIALARYGALVPLRWWLFLAAAAVSSALLFRSAAGFLVPLPDYPRFVLAAAPLAYAVLYAGLRMPRWIRRVRRRIGDLSYGLYLWHPIVIAVLLRSGWSAGTETLVLVLVIAGLLAFTSWHLVEKPTQRFKRQPSTI